MVNYGDTAGLDAYWSERGYTVSPAPDAAGKTALLIKASQYIDGLGFGHADTGVRVVMWPGSPVSVDQELQWPRAGAEDIYGNTIAETVPSRIARATYEAAFFIAGGGDVNRATSPDRIVTREKVDVIETSYAEQTGAAAKDTRPVLPAVADLLAPLLIGGASNQYGISLVTAE